MSSDHGETGSNMNDQPNDHHEDSQRGASTFEGRLQLDDFAYNGGSTQAPLRRRSARISAAPSPPFKSRSGPSQTTSRKGALSPSPARINKSTSRRNDTGNENGSGNGSGSSIPQKANKKKRSRPAAGYAPPSTYAHLPELPDAVAPNMLVLFVGLNPGIETARSGHAYAHPSNLFWKLLFSSGVTPRPCTAQEDRSMPQLYALGLTNIVSRPSRNGSELSKQEMDAGVAALHEKARRWRPESLCLVGKSIWESVWRVQHGRGMKKEEFKYGWQDEEENMGVVDDCDGEEAWPGARVFVASSTSGLAATLSPAQKQEIWNELGSWVKKRRAEREAEGI